MTQVDSPRPASQIAKDDPSPIIAREGWPIVAIFVLIGLGLAGVAWWLAGWVVGVVAVAIAAILILWCIWFFRDPPRKTPLDPRLIIAPADGVVVSMTAATPPTELNLPSEVVAGMQRVCIFMNVFNVHVNRSPAAGAITAAAYHEGKFFNASLDKASEQNERFSVAMRTTTGHIIGFVQIAGLVARRIVRKVQAGETLRQGQRYGLIRFGSRVDVYIPAGSVINVKLGQTTVAGETVLATLPEGSRE